MPEQQQNRREQDDQSPRTLPPRKLSDEELDKVAGGARKGNPLKIMLKDC